MTALDELQAYRSMLEYVRYYNSLVESDDIVLMLDAMELVGDRATSDPGTWHDWLQCVARVVGPGDRDASS